MGAAACGLFSASPSAAAVGAVLGWALILLACVDVLALRLPDLATLPLVAAGLAWGLQWREPPLADRLIGAAAGWLALTVVGWLFARLRGREGLGAGDAKLLAAAGAWLGWRALPGVVLIGCAAGFAWVAVAVPLKGKRALAEPLPFGLPLCIGIWIVWLMQTAGLG
jgi:leader peptidase (prepilin peptidase) / N-methyltransferase